MNTGQKTIGGLLIVVAVLLVVNLGMDVSGQGREMRRGHLPTDPIAREIRLASDRARMAEMQAHADRQQAIFEADWSAARAEAVAASLGPFANAAISEPDHLHNELAKLGLEQALEIVRLRNAVTKLRADFRAKTLEGARGLLENTEMIVDNTKLIVTLRDEFHAEQLHIRALILKIKQDMLKNAEWLDELSEKVEQWHPSDDQQQPNPFSQAFPSIDRN